MKNYLIRILNYLIRIVAVLSHLLNVVTGGSRFYTFSARTYYCAKILKLRKWTYILLIIDTIFFLQPNHCEIEYTYESKEGKKPIYYKLK